ncbi:MAG: ras guanine nucleotide exchange factor domain-containing protein [Benniella sp.]|nr:MAG: ras guanine nucleotide exchange factor domain-containing protein [Benniella sp.]
MSQYSHMRQSSSGVAVIPEGCVDPSNLVEAKRIDGDGDDHLELKSYGPSDHLPMIPISPLRITHRSLVEKEESWTATLGDTRNRIQELMQKQGDNEEQGKPDNEIATLNDEAYKCATQINNTMATILKVRELLYRSAGITSILEFPPYLVAYQLTLVESAIFLEILPSAFLTHSPKTPQRSITASTDFFNYLTRMIEYSILFPPEASGRAQIINHWIKVAVKLHELENFQTLKAVLCALVTPPIKRLKRTWGFTPRKSISKLEMLSDLMSEDRNYGKYREMMNGLCSGTITSPGEISSPVPPELAISMAASRLESSSGSMGLDMRPKDVARRPVVPFLGTFIMDMTYLLAAVKKNGGGIQAAASVPLSKLPATGLRKSLSVVTNIDPRIQELLMTFSAYQSGPRYSPQPPRSFIKASTKTQNHFRAPSLSSALQKTTKYRNSNAVERERQFVFDDEDDDLLGSTGIGSGGIRSTQQLILHYLLTRPWAPERMVDELSMIREPSKNNSSSASISSNSSTSSGTGSSSSSMKNVFYHSSLNQEESRLEDD